MAYNKANVLVGAATLFLNDATVGWTNGGVQIELSKESYDVEVDQEPSPVKSFRIKEAWKIKTNLVETTLENLKIAWGIEADIDATTLAGYRTLGFGGSQEDPTEYTMDIYGKSPGTPSRERRIHFYRVVAVEFGAYSMEKNKEQMIPVTFLALADSSQTDGEQVGYVKDQTVRTTTNLVIRVTITSA